MLCTLSVCPPIHIKEHERIKGHNCYYDALYIMGQYVAHPHTGQGIVTFGTLWVYTHPYIYRRTELEEVEQLVGPVYIHIDGCINLWRQNVHRGQSQQAKTVNKLSVNFFMTLLDDINYNSSRF